MTFMKILMAMVLLSAVLSKESWADGDEPKKFLTSKPLICEHIVQYLAGTDEPGNFDYFKVVIAKDQTSKTEKEILYPNRVERHIRNVYEHMKFDFNKLNGKGADKKSLDQNLENCALKLNEESRNLGTNLGLRDAQSSERAADFDNIFNVVEDTTHETETAKSIGGTCVGNAADECSDEPENGFNLDPSLKDWYSYERRRSPVLGPVNTKVKAYDPKDCLCHHGKLVEAGKSTEKLGPDIDQEVQKIQDLIVEESARKFLNNYTAVSEDMNYIASAEAKIFNYHAGTKISENERLCQDPAGFLKEVNDLCTKNGTTNGSAERMSRIMSVADPKLKGLPFDQALMAMNDDIGFLELPKSAVKPGQPTRLKRSEYDKGRFAIGNNDLYPSLKFANGLLTELIKKSELEEPILEKISKGQEPFSAILDFMTDPKNNKAMDKVLKSMSENFKTFRHGDLFERMLTLKDKQLKDGKGRTNPFKVELSNLFREAFQVSPKMKNLMMDGQLFTSMSKKFWIGKGSHVSGGLLQVINDDKVQYMKAMASRCTKVQKEFAQNVCAKPDEVIKGASTDDVLSLLQRKRYDKSEDQDVVNMALCKFSKEQPNKDSIFSNFLYRNSNPHLRSDYLPRKLNPDNKDSAYYKLAVKLLDDKAARDLARMVNSSASEGSSIAKFQSSSTNDANQLFTSKQVRSESAPTSAVANNPASTETAAAPSRDVASVGASDIAKTISAPAAISNSSGYVPATSTAPIASPEEGKSSENIENVTRDRLAKELGGSENKNRVKDHISSVNEKDAEEIFRLRDQAMKDRQTISELRLQQERDKTEALRGEYEQLKARFDNLEKSGPATAAAAPNITSAGTGTSTTGGVPHFETATLAAPIAAAGSTGGRASGIASQSSMGGSASLGDSNSGSSNAAGAGSSVTTTATASSGGSDSRGLALTVTQSVGVDGKVSSVEDPNKALINYLTKNEPTEKQLQELKTSGLVLTEEDISKDGQKVKTKKMIKFHELSPEAKSLVEKKLAQVKLQEVKRNYSRQALILELFTASTKKSNLNVKKSGSLNF